MPVIPIIDTSTTIKRIIIIPIIISINASIIITIRYTQTVTPTIPTQQDIEGLYQLQETEGLKQMLSFQI